MPSESLDLHDFHYHLPEEYIARHPLENRADAKLLFYNKGEITHQIFNQVPRLLPRESFLVFNDTKVIPARLVFHKPTGARIEIFLLDPLSPSSVYEPAMASKGACTWHVMIGNSRKWKVGQSLSMTLDGQVLSATRTAEDQVSFHWGHDATFSDVLSEAGEIPLPPYLGREATEADVPRYQTVYSRAEGAVAAPTAGLHFTPQLLSEISSVGIKSDFLTLHVSAGTFQPIKARSIEDHPMHREQVLVSRQNVLNLLENDLVIPVGTTSMRTLESLFWYGQLLAHNPEAAFGITKNTPYQFDSVVSKKASLLQVLGKMDRDGTDVLIGHTEIFIYPGYTFRMCKGLITNFHLPGSTLILLVAAMVGADWRKIYETALAEDYRFLSYGDSSLLLP